MTVQTESQRMQKRVSPAEAVSRIKDGDTLLVGGFGLSGTPLTLIAALAEHGTARGLTTVSNNCGTPNEGLGRLLLQNRLRRVIGSFFTPNKDVGVYKEAGKLEVSLMPQGTLAEAIRAGGAGIPAFFTPTAVDTELAADKEVREFGGRRCVLEHAIRGNVALVKAHRADENGSLTYRMAARNFNPVMATAADLVIAEVDEIVPVGALAPEEIVTPHLFVDLLVLSSSRER